MFAVFVGFSAEETTKISKHRTTGMSKSSGFEGLLNFAYDSLRFRCYPGVSPRLMPCTFDAPFISNISAQLFIVTPVVITSSSNKIFLFFILGMLPLI